MISCKLDLIFFKSGGSAAYWAAQSMETVSVAAEWISNQTGCANDNDFLNCLGDIPGESLLNVRFLVNIFDANPE